MIYWFWIRRNYLRVLLNWSFLFLQRRVCIETLGIILVFMVLHRVLEAHRKHISILFLCIASLNMMQLILCLHINTLVNFPSRIDICCRWRPRVRMLDCLRSIAFAQVLIYLICHFLRSPSCGSLNPTSCFGLL